MGARIRVENALAIYNNTFCFELEDYDKQYYDKHFTIIPRARF